MHFLYFLALCFAATVPVHTTIIITGNLKDFRSLAKKLSHKSNRIVVSESDSTYNDEQTDGTVEDSQQNVQQDITDVITELIKHIGKPPSNKDRLKKIIPLATKKPPMVLHIDDVVEKVKLKLLQEILAKSSDARKLNAAANTLVRTAQEEQTQLPSPVVNKVDINKSTDIDVDSKLVQTPVPMKVVKEEIQFEATYEEAPDKDVDLQIQNVGEEAQNPKPVQVKLGDKTKNSLTVKNKSFKKVRFVKQVVVPANLNEEQPSILQQPSLIQQPVTAQPNSKPQTPVVEQPNLVRQLTLMQHQIDQINKTALQKLTMEAEDQKTKTEEDNSKSLADARASDEINDADADDVTPSKEKEEDNEREQSEATVEEDELTEGTGTVEEEGESAHGENEEDANEATQSDALRSKADKVESNARIPTKEFGTVVNEPLSQKTNDFNGPGKKEVGNFNLTLIDDAYPGARKVMLF